MSDGPQNRCARDRRRGFSREPAHANPLDADIKGPLREAILFESSGGQADKVAHLPELCFALGEPELDTTSIHNAAFAIEDRSYLIRIRKVGSDGFRIGYQRTVKKVVRPSRVARQGDGGQACFRKLVEDEFRRGASILVVPFPGERAKIPDTPRLTLVLADPEVEWAGGVASRADRRMDAPGEDDGRPVQITGHWVRP
jgi:hypothetical protein